jgi:hypothetical protein
MHFRIKLVQHFLTMISQKLSPDNLLSWSTFETCMMERLGMFSDPNSFINRGSSEGGHAGSADTCCPLAVLRVSASPEPRISHAVQVKQNVTIPGFSPDPRTPIGGSKFVTGQGGYDELFSGCLL